MTSRSRAVLERDVRVVRASGTHEDPAVDDLAQGGTNGGRRAGRRPTRAADRRRSAPPAADATRRSSCPASDTAATPGASTTLAQAQPARPRRAGLARRGDDLLGIERVPVGPLQRSGRPCPASGTWPNSSASRRVELVTRSKRARSIRSTRSPRSELGQEGEEPRHGDRLHRCASSRRGARCSSRRLRTRNASRSLGRAVGPLDVLNDDHDRADPRQSARGPRGRARTAGPARTARRATNHRPSDASGRRSRPCRSGRPRTSGMSRASSSRLGPSKGRQRAGVNVAKECAERLDEGPVRKAARSRAEGSHRSGPGRPNRRACRSMPRPGASCRSRPRRRGRPSATPGGRTRVGPR